MNTNRPADTIKRDMLEWAREHLYARIGEEWDYNGRDFDPLVHLLVGACASEVRGVYEAMEGADRRIVKKLAELLVPDPAHLAVPARALASVVPTGSVAHLPETLQFRCDAEGGPYYFTPALDCTLLNSTLKVVGSDGLIFQYGGGGGKGSGRYTYVSKILLGFEAPKPITSFDNVLFYFDLLGPNHQFLFLQAVAEGTWKINGQPIEKSRGFRKAGGAAEAPAAGGVEEVYRPYFFTTDQYPGHPLSRRDISEVVISWLRENHTDTPVLEQQAQALPLVEDNFFWIEIQLPFPVRVLDMEQNFRCATNVFPVLNRRLHVKDDAETFLNRPGVDVLCVTPEGPFAVVHRVENLQNREVLPALPLQQLRRGRGPAYSLRYGGVGRLDNFNAWQRLSYLLGLFREEHRYREVLERIGDKVSLEDLHLLIGDKVLRDAPEPPGSENDVYFFLHPGESLRGGLRARITYWTTGGARANHIPAGKALAGDPPEPALRRDGAVLLTAPAGGRDAPGETEYFEGLRNRLLPHDKVVTRADAVRFCHQFVGPALRAVRLEPGFAVDARPGGGLVRVLKVLLEADEPGNPAWAGRCRELEYLLNEKSSGVVPYQVMLNQDADAQL
jgi:hypothetical protein